MKGPVYVTYKRRLGHVTVTETGPADEIFRKVAALFHPSRYGAELRDRVAKDIAAELVKLIKKGLKDELFDMAALSMATKLLKKAEGSDPRKMIATGKMLRSLYKRRIAPGAYEVSFRYYSSSAGHSSLEMARMVRMHEEGYSYEPTDKQLRFLFARLDAAGLKRMEPEIRRPWHTPARKFFPQAVAQLRKEVQKTIPQKLLRHVLGLESNLVK